MRRIEFCLIACLLSVSMAATPVQASVTYTITDLGTLSGNFSQGLGINAAGAVVGFADTSGGGPERGFLNAGTMQPLATLGGETSYARSIDAGTFVGESQLANGEVHAFYATLPGSLQDMNTWGGTYSSARRIKGNVIVGQAENAAGDLHAFRYLGGAMTDLGTLGGSTSIAHGVNVLGQIVGNAQTADGIDRAFRHAGGALDTPVGIPPLSSEPTAESGAYAVNDAGLIVGWTDTGSFATFDFERHAFLYKAGVMTDLHAAGAFSELASRAYDVNNLGQVVGTADDARGFLYDDATHTMYDLNALIPAASGWTITSAQAINDAGQIVASGFDGAQHRALLLTPVPEPGTVSLLLAAAVGGSLLVSRRRGGRGRAERLA